jgi:hypothetical protein
LLLWPVLWWLRRRETKSERASQTKNPASSAMPEV